MSFGISKPGSETTTSNMDEIVKQIFSQGTQTQNNSTGTSETTQTQDGATTGQSSGQTKRVLSPYQEAVQPQLFKIISALSSDPRAFLAPQQNVAREQVNENFAGVGDSLRQNFLSGGGGGGTGKFGRAVLASDLARRHALSKVDNDFASQAAQLPVTAANLSQAFLGLNFGEETSGRTEATTTGKTVGSNVTTDQSTGSVDTVGTTTTDRRVDQTGKTKRGLGFSAGI